jgi:hypothetical protein
MDGHELTRDETTEQVEFEGLPTRADGLAPPVMVEDELEWHRAETDRLRVLVEFLSRPIHAPGGSDPDPDVLTAYNLAVEAALKSVRQAALVLERRRTPGPF